MRRLFPLLVLLACSDYNFSSEPVGDRPPADEDDGGGTDGDVNDTGEDTDDTGDPPVEGEPIADAGADQLVKPLDWVQLDGRDSIDPNNRYPLTYQWQVVSIPSGSTATLLDRASSTPRFWADLAGDYTFELTVRNADGVWDSTPDRVTITAEPTDGFYVQMSWDNGTDQDLHLMRGGARLYQSPGDCNYCNLNPNWGGSGSLDDPSLDYDTIDGFGPETITIDQPAADTYTIAVVYYGEDGAPYCNWSCPPTVATVRLFMNGVEARSWTRTLREAGDVWMVARVDWPSQRITDINADTTTELTGCF
jgi:hypothetical protein